VPAELTIGDFARATHLGVKTLRHYHRVGVLQPADIDPDTGYRSYTTDQIPTAQVIRRFRDLEMPLEDIKAVLTAEDLGARNAVISAHLDRLQATLARTEAAANALHDLLERPADASPPGLEHTSVAAAPAAAISDTVQVESLSAWFQGALGELRATLQAQHNDVTGPAGGLYETELFADELGNATVFIPCEPGFRTTGRVQAVVIPPAELATTVHAGSHADIDLAYGALATYVANHALGVEGPIREYYLVGRLDTSDESQWRTQIGWPIFATAR
jgi:DNA-binding transcriptional MerR regulator